MLRMSNKLCFEASFGKGICSLYWHNCSALPVGNACTASVSKRRNCVRHCVASKVSGGFQSEPGPRIRYSSPFDILRQRRISTNRALSTERRFTGDDVSDTSSSDSAPVGGCRDEKQLSERNETKASEEFDDQNAKPCDNEQPTCEQLRCEKERSDLDLPRAFQTHNDLVRSLNEQMRGDPLESWGGRVVIHRGNPEAKLMIIGEGPGRDEDRLGKPFVGKAGVLLDDIFTYAGFDMDRHVYVTNVVKRRPPDNRTPTPDEIEYYLPLLTEEIRLVDPSIIILAGATPLKAILNMTGISKVRGKQYLIECAGKPRHVMPIFHPAYLLRNAVKKHDMKIDIDNIRALYMRLFPDHVLAEPRKTKPRR